MSEGGGSKVARGRGGAGGLEKTLFTHYTVRRLLLCVVMLGGRAGDGVRMKRSVVGMGGGGWRRPPTSSAMTCRRCR